MKEGKTMRQRLYEAMKSDTPELDIWDLLDEQYRKGGEKDIIAVIIIFLVMFAAGYAFGYFSPFSLPPNP